MFAHHWSKNPRVSAPRVSIKELPLEGVHGQLGFVPKTL